MFRAVAGVEAPRRPAFWKNKPTSALGGSRQGGCDRRAQFEPCPSIACQCACHCFRPTRLRDGSARSVAFDWQKRSAVRTAIAMSPGLWSATRLLFLASVARAYPLDCDLRIEAKPRLAATAHPDGSQFSRVGIYPIAFHAQPPRQLCGVDHLVLLRHLPGIKKLDDAASDGLDYLRIELYRSWRHLNRNVHFAVDLPRTGFSKDSSVSQETSQRFKRSRASRVLQRPWPTQWQVGGPWALCRFISMTRPGHSRKQSAAVAANEVANTAFAATSPQKGGLSPLERS